MPSCSNTLYSTVEVSSSTDSSSRQSFVKSEGRDRQKNVASDYVPSNSRHHHILSTVGSWLGLETRAEIEGPRIDLVACSARLHSELGSISRPFSTLSAKISPPHHNATQLSHSRIQGVRKVTGTHTYISSPSHHRQRRGRVTPNLRLRHHSRRLSIVKVPFSHHRSCHRTTRICQTSA